MEYDSKVGKRCKFMKANGKRCARWASRGKDRCPMHGGITTGIIRVSYSFQTEKMRAVYERFRDDPDRVDLSGELALLRTLMQGILDRFQGNPDQFPLELISTVKDLVSDIGATAERLNRIEKGLQINVNVMQIRMVTEQLAVIIANRVSDPAIVEQVMQDFERVRLPTIPSDGTRPWKREDEVGGTDEDAAVEAAIDAAGDGKTDVQAADNAEPLRDSDAVGDIPDSGGA